MKTVVTLLCLLLVPLLAVAQTNPSAKAATDKAEDQIGKIEGTVLNRPNGEFLGLTLMDGKYKLTFYNKKKKPTKVDVTRGVARWPNKHGPGNHQTVLNVAGDGTYLMGAQFVRGPHAFVLIIVLLKEEGDETKTVETHSVQFRG